MYRQMMPRAALAASLILASALITGCTADPSVKKPVPCDTPLDATGTDGGQGLDAGADAASDAGTTDAGTTYDAGGDAAADDSAGDGGGSAGNGSDKWVTAFDKLFKQDKVLELKLTFADGGWLKLLTDWKEKKKKVYYPASLDFDGLPVAKVGVRLKGLSSLSFPSSGKIDPTRKYPLKIDFNRFGGPRLEGIDKLSLSNSINDRSFMRERLAARMYNKMGLPAPRTSYARVTIDGVYIGIYVVVQPVDKRFLKERFGTAGHLDDGNLYKCVHNSKGVCSLAWKGEDKVDYLLQDSCQPSYDDCGLVLKTNEDEAAWNSYGDLTHLIDVLNHTPIEHLKTALPKVLDVEAVLRYLAVTFVMSSFDSYLGKSNNFYLYHAMDSGRFSVLPWDFDGAYNGLYCKDLNDPACSGGSAMTNYPLSGRILAVPAWNQRFREIVKEALDGPFTVDQHKTWITEFDGLVGEHVAGDPNYPNDLAHYKKLTTLTPLPGFTENMVAFVAKRRADLLAELAKK